MVYSTSFTADESVEPAYCKVDLSSALVVSQAQDSKVTGGLTVALVEESVRTCDLCKWNRGAVRAGAVTAGE